MDNGYWEKVLRVDLTNKTYKIEDVPESVWKMFVGGSGFGAKVLLEEVPPKIDPLAPENKIIFAIGAMQALKVPGSGKWSVVTKSPLTKTFLDSAGGGHWAPLFKGCGYEALIIEGKSKSPIYIYITEENVEFKEASHIWGKDTVETTEIIKNELNNNRVSMINIGPSGEISNPIACITCDGHSFAGRGGSGAVMGSKNLKAVAVFGKKQVPVHNMEQGRKKAVELMKLLAKQGEMGTKYGTTTGVISSEVIGNLPIKYWNEYSWPDAEKIGHVKYHETLQVKPLPCIYCPIGCHRHIKLEKNGVISDANGPEYETLGLMGGSFLCSDLMAICEANDICNRMGIDTISNGAFISFLAECWEKGLINEKDTGGLKIEWGDGKVLIELTKQIAQLKGMGKWFKEGIQGAAKVVGPEAEDIVVQVKNMDYPAHDPRCFLSLGVNYATGTRGACHMRGCTMGVYYPELHIGMKEAPNSIETAALQTFINQNASSFFNQATLCFFMVDMGGLTITQLLEIFNLITGWNWTPDDLSNAGRRAFTIQRLINVRDGFSRKDDTLPKKMTVAAKEGPRAGKAPIPHDKILDDYYKLRAWDKNGFPTKESLQRIGLDEYSKYLVNN